MQGVGLAYGAGVPSTGVLEGGPAPASIFSTSIPHSKHNKPRPPTYPSPLPHCHPYTLLPRGQGQALPLDPSYSPSPGLPGILLCPTLQGPTGGLLTLDPTLGNG